MNRLDEIRTALIMRGMSLATVDGKPFTFCGCGYQAEIDERDPMFAHLHSCPFTEAAVKDWRTAAGLRLP